MNTTTEPTCSPEQCLRGNQGAKVLPELSAEQMKAIARRVVGDDPVSVVTAVRVVQETLFALAADDPLPSQASLESPRVDMPPGLTDGEKRAFMLGVAAGSGGVAEVSMTMLPQDKAALNAVYEEATRAVKENDRG